MITHDVDEAILLADRIFLMTNGPNARIAESVRVDIPRPRTRTSVIHDPGYYAIRNHLVEFLVNRSAVERDSDTGSADAPLEVNPAHQSNTAASASVETFSAYNVQNPQSSHSASQNHSPASHLHLYAGS